MGRPPIGKHAMSDAERQRRYMERLNPRAGDNGTVTNETDIKLIARLRAEIERLRAKLRAARPTRAATATQKRRRGARTSR
jgi:hypothetical protein